MRRELPRNSEGKKMYPVCSWERCQHKIYTEHDRAVVRVINENHSEESVEWSIKVDEAMALIDRNIIDGIVYATWEDGKILKEVLRGYDERHLANEMKREV